ncbi:hypothetical protein [Aureimonas mangrovi]|uniref:hypothetical protein n=1 Tax=Aureimonas mangrovi TaxID=2758041 RepID=UPI00163D52C1|nr:hypothetical protein [Aureimonas mangrovi]
MKALRRRDALDLVRKACNEAQMSGEADQSRWIYLFDRQVASASKKRPEATRSYRVKLRHELLEQLASLEGDALYLPHHTTDPGYQVSIKLYRAFIRLLDRRISESTSA